VWSDRSRACRCLVISRNIHGDDELYGLFCGVRQIRRTGWEVVVWELGVFYSASLNVRVLYMVSVGLDLMICRVQSPDIPRESAWLIY